PVIRPLTSAAKPAEPSCAVSTNSTPPLRIASISGSTLPLGMPKPREIPFALSVATIRSALFMAGETFHERESPCNQGGPKGGAQSGRGKTGAVRGGAGGRLAAGSIFCHLGVRGARWSPFVMPSCSLNRCPGPWGVWGGALGGLMAGLWAGAAVAPATAAED